jgi:methylenetetrahydrofolate reductase (NADPH)
MSRLGELLASRTRPIVTAELPMINSGDLELIKEKLANIAPHVDAINATDNASARAHASNTALAIAIKQLGAEPIMQVVCRDKNRLAMQADIIGAAIFGVENVCALTGDDVTAGDEPEARRVFDLDGAQLIRLATGLRDGHFMSGRKVTHPPALIVGAVENPFAPPLEHRVERAAKKSEAGAQFLQLQIGYYPERLESFVAGCVAAGITQRTALLPTICLTKAARPLNFMNDQVPGISIPTDVIDRIANAADPAEESYQFNLEQAKHALSLPGVAGIHLADFRHDDTISRIVNDLGLQTTSGPTPEQEQHAHGSRIAG